MIGFVNERSLEDHGDWSNRLLTLLVFAQELKLAGAVLLKDSNYFYRVDFLQVFHRTSLPKDERALIRELVFSKRYFDCWRPMRLSVSTEQFSSEDPEFCTCDESICEATERRLANGADSITLLSAADSSFGAKSQVVVTKIRTQQGVQLQNASQIDSLRLWIATIRGTYDRGSAEPPTDSQTILERDQRRFRRTSWFDRKHRRRVFEEIETGRLFYVDHAHPGHSAHLEVFDRQGEHLGTADIESGQLDAHSVVEGRRFRV